MLRKELEALLVADSLALARSTLRESHPIAYWNLVFYCRRLDLPTHLLAWLAPNVHIRCIYDRREAHSTGDGSNPLPLYLAAAEADAQNDGSGAGDVAAQRARQQIIASLPEERGLFRILQCLVQHHREVSDRQSIYIRVPQTMSIF